MEPIYYLFCTYLTVYSGNKLPPFYIGSSSIHKITKLNYHGSVLSKNYKKIWDQELKEYPELFKTYILTVHFLRKEAYSKEEQLQRSLNVVNSLMYINMHIANTNDYSMNGRQKSPGMLNKHHTTEMKESNKIRFSGKNNPMWKTTRPEVSAFMKIPENHPMSKPENIEKARKRMQERNVFSICCILCKKIFTQNSFPNSKNHLCWLG